MTNPFCTSSKLNTPLIPEVCQQIHAEALLRVARGLKEGTVPNSVPAARLRELMYHLGPEICLMHPTEIEALFCGVTCSVYQQIEALYCSKMCRSVQTVVAILSLMARSVAVPPIHEEAIWALCLHLDERREREIRVTIHQCLTSWWVGEIVLGSLPTGEEEGQDTLITVIDISIPCVLAFRVGPRRSDADLLALSLYDALVGARHPNPSGAGGLVWEVPNCLLTTEPLPLTCEIACASFGVRIERASTAIPLIEDLRTYWRDIHARGSVPIAQRALVFDSILNRAYGESPFRTREQADHRFGRFIGYQNDPASLVPALRTLLPLHDASINTCGEVFSDGLHYTDALLSLFPEAHVSIRRSEQTEAVIWVYLDGEILGEARARELARRDGSYRAHR